MMDYISLDLETTGLNPKRDRIIEVGAVKVHRGEVAGEFQSLVNPGRELGEKVCGLTGINDEMLLDAPEIGDIIGPLLKFIGEQFQWGKLRYYGSVCDCDGKGRPGDFPGYGGFIF